ncbi:Low temperature viability protein, partial [Protomyces lactucae-debilis]
MGRRKFIDKKQATTFQLVHRSQRDAEYHNDEASARVLVPLGKGDSSDTGARATVQTKSTLEKEFGDQVRANEGEAAEYGVYFDDTEYDYMQHLRPTGSVDAVLLENPETKARGKKKEAFNLPDEAVPSGSERPRNYQDQQAVQDSISGFKPDLDPSIREVLEALEEEEQEESVDEDAPADDSEAWFNELTAGGEVADAGDWDEEFDEGWESDDTAKATRPAARANKSEWEQEFSQFKRAGQNAIDEEGSVVSQAFTAASQGRIKHGNGSIGTGFSMSSSALWRTEGLTLLDDRFDRIERQYDIEEEEKDEMEDYDPAKPVRSDFDGIMDEFLGEFENMGKKGVQDRRRNQYSLDDARNAMGRIRV